MIDDSWFIASIFCLALLVAPGNHYSTRLYGGAMAVAIYFLPQWVGPVTFVYLMTLYRRTVLARCCPNCSYSLSKYRRRTRDSVLVRLCEFESCSVRAIPRHQLYANLPLWARLLPSYRQ